MTCSCFQVVPDPVYDTRPGQDRDTDSGCCADVSHTDSHSSHDDATPPPLDLSSRPPGEFNHMLEIIVQKFRICFGIVHIHILVFTDTRMISVV